MTLNQVLLASLLTIILVSAIYKHITFNAIKECYSNWFQKEYWNSYNIVEAASWAAKAIVIVPGLIFGVSIWQLYFVTLITSAMLIWVSEKKILPTLVGFNTLWIWLSFMVISQHLIK